MSSRRKEVLQKGMLKCASRKQQIENVTMGLVSDVKNLFRKPCS